MSQKNKSGKFLRYFTFPFLLILVFNLQTFARAGDLDVTFDGDGKFDYGVFRPADSGWYINRSTAGLLIQQFGLSTDKPVPAGFAP